MIIWSYNISPSFFNEIKNIRWIKQAKKVPVQILQYWNEKLWANIDTFLHTAVSLNRAFVKNLIPFSKIYQKIWLSFCRRVPFALFFFHYKVNHNYLGLKLRHFQGCLAIMGYSRKKSNIKEGEREGGVGRVLRTKNIWGYWRKSIWKFQGIN